MVLILQKQTDAAGNLGWVLIDQVNIDPSTALSYITNLALDGNHYMAETIGDDGITANVLAQV